MSNYRSGMLDWRRGRSQLQYRLAATPPELKVKGSWWRGRRTCTGRPPPEPGTVGLATRPSWCTSTEAEPSSPSGIIACLSYARTCPKHQWHLGTAQEIVLR